MYIDKIAKLQSILENGNRDATIKRVHAPTQENVCAKYQYDPLNIVGCKVVMNAVPHTGQCVFIKFQSAARS